MTWGHGIDAQSARAEEKWQYEGCTPLTDALPINVVNPCSEAYPAIVFIS
jgi:hypothetical protein